MDNKEVSLLKSRLNFITAILKVGHETFHKIGTELKAVHILNNSRHVLSYDRACIIQHTGKKPKIIGVSGVAKVNINSEFSILMSDLISALLPLKTKININAKQLKEKFDQTNININEYLIKFPNVNLLVIPLFPFETERHAFYWVMEYFEEYDDSQMKKTSLLSEFYREALWYSFYSEQSKIKKFLYGNKLFSPGKIVATLFLLFVVCSFIIPVNLSVSAEFEIVPETKQICYAPFAGIIKKVYHADGDNIKKGELVIAYDTEDYKYQLAKAEAVYNTENARLDYIRQFAFQDKNELGKIKIISYQKDAEKEKMNEFKWYLKNSELISDFPGTLVIDEKYELEGKFVNPGEKLFEVVPFEQHIAEVYLNQADSSVLKKITSINLFLYNQPVTSLPGEVLFVSSKPEITVNNQFCYVIKVKLTENVPFLYYGMRGIAKVNGERVSLAYYIVRNIVLWWRKY